MSDHESHLQARLWPKLGWLCRLQRHKSHRLDPMGGMIGPLTLWTICETCGVIGSDRKREITEGSALFQEIERSGNV